MLSSVIKLNSIITRKYLFSYYETAFTAHTGVRWVFLRQDEMLKTDCHIHFWTEPAVRSCSHQILTWKWIRYWYGKYKQLRLPSLHLEIWLMILVKRHGLVLLSLLSNCKTKVTYKTRKWMHKILTKGQLSETSSRLLTIVQSKQKYSLHVSSVRGSIQNDK